MGNTASQAQIQFINSLKERHDTSNEQAAKALELGRRLWAVGKFDKMAASALIDALKDAPETTTEAPEGMHLLDGVVYKVQRAVHGSGRLYAKALVQGEYGDWSFEYAAGAVKRLSEGTLMTLDQAKQFGAQTGTCVFCAKILTDERSIDAGYGPTCASNNELPWG